MKSLKEVAILVKEEFNNPKYVVSYTGLCITLLTLNNHKIISNAEKHKLFTVISDELDKRIKIYTYNLYGESNKIPLTVNNYERAYIWKPFDKRGRNKFLNKIINS